MSAEKVTVQPNTSSQINSPTSKRLDLDVIPVVVLQAQR